MGTNEFDRRVELQEKLESVMRDYGYIPHVYWQQPSNKKMEYPAILYSMDNVKIVPAYYHIDSGKVDFI